MKRQQAIKGPIVFAILAALLYQTCKNKNVCDPESNQRFIPMTVSYVIPSLLGTQNFGFTESGIAAGSLAAFIQGQRFGTSFPGFRFFQSLGSFGLLGFGGWVSVLSPGVYWVADSFYYSNETATIENEFTLTKTELGLNLENAPKFGSNSVDPCVKLGNDTVEICSGHGTCERGNSYNMVFCRCDTDYSGNYCETKETTFTGSPISTTPIIITATTTENNELAKVDPELTDESWIYTRHIIWIGALFGSIIAFFAAWWLKKVKLGTTETNLMASGNIIIVNKN